MENRYLYKAKRIDDGEWVQGALFDGESHCIIGQEIKFSPYIEHECKIVGYKVDRNTICQCTGLKDKNGKLIWENDILDGFTYPYMSDGVHNYYVEVCWCTNVPSFGIYTQKYPESKVAGISAGMTELMEDWNSNDWEVIGNIFDNPELLEV